MAKKTLTKKQLKEVIRSMIKEQFEDYGLDMDGRDDRGRKHFVPRKPKDDESLSTKVLPPKPKFKNWKEELSDMLETIGWDMDIIIDFFPPEFSDIKTTERLIDMLNASDDPKSIVATANKNLKKYY